jgi:hypothetical protein
VFEVYLFDVVGGSFMAKENKDQSQAEAALAAPPEQQQQQQQAPQQIELDETGAATCYSNFCRVTGSPEELIIDFGLNTQTFGVPEQPIKVNQRLIINFFTAKRLLGALSMAIQRHEAAFGVLETNVQKRIRT